MPPLAQLDVDLWGEVSSGYVNYYGVLLEDVDATSTDGRVTINIPKLTKVLDCDGQPLDEIRVTLIDPPPTPPEGYHLIAAFDFGPCCAFDPGIAITLAYDSDALPEGVDGANLVIGFLDGAAGEWEFMAGVVDTDVSTVTFSVDHFTIFAILAQAAPTPTPTPAPAPGLGPGAWVWIVIAIIWVIPLGLVIWLTIGQRWVAGRRLRSSRRSP